MRAKPVNYSIIFRLLGAIQFILCLAFTVCMGVAYIYRDLGNEATAIASYSYCVVATLILGGLFLYLGRGKNKTFFKKEAIAVIGLGWVTAILVGALPYWIMLDSCDLADAIFESTSGLTTTGATVFDELESYPHSLLFWRSLSQWIGGMGVVVFFVAVLSFLGAGGKILFTREYSGTAAELDFARIQTGVLRLWLLYLILSSVCTTVYFLGGMSFYEALNHTFTTIATGGFSTMSASIAGFESPLLEWSTIAFMTLGGTSFLWMLLVFNKNWHSVRMNSEVKAYYAIILLAASLVTFVLITHEGYSNWHDAIRSSLFQVISIMTTTGYSTRDFESWNLTAQVLLLGLMAVGGCSGSTSCGLKVVRILVGVKSALRMVGRSYSNRVIQPIHMNGRVLDNESREGVVTYIVLNGWLLLFSMPILAILEPAISFEGCSSAVMACIFNVGPAFGEFGPTDNYGFLRDYSKYFLSVLMVMGRLELFAILALFIPSFWKRFS